MVSLWRGGLLSIVLGVILLGVGIGVWLWRAGFSSHAIRADGTVVALSSGDPARTTRGFAPVVQFVADGRTVRVMGEVFSRPPDYSVGDPVQVLYERGDPQGARIDGFWERWLFPLICGVIGLACVGGGAAELKNTLRERTEATHPNADRRNSRRGRRR